MNSTAVVLMIITVLTYGIVCIGKRMELMDAVTVSFAVLLAGFGMSGGILALSADFRSIRHWRFYGCCLLWRR